MSTILLFAIVITCFAGCAESLSPEKAREKLAEKCLQSVYTCNTEMVEEYAPVFLWDFYKQGVRRAGYDFVEKLDISLDYGGELSNREILHIENEYANEANITFSIDEAHRYHFEITYYSREDDGTLEARTETDDDAGLVVAKINGNWYAIEPSL